MIACRVIQNLQGNRPEIVKLFDEFVRAAPDGVYFVQMERKGLNVSLEGFAESNNRVSALMRIWTNRKSLPIPI